MYDYKRCFCCGAEVKKIKIKPIMPIIIEGFNAYSIDLEFDLIKCQNKTCGERIFLPESAKEFRKYFAADDTFAFQELS